MTTNTKIARYSAVRDSLPTAGDKLHFELMFEGVIQGKFEITDAEWNEAIEQALRYGKQRTA